jgi:hypothetical protein
MKNTILILTVWFLFPVLMMAGEKEEAYLKETMIPLARDFLQRTGQTNNLPLGTNQIKNYKLDYFDDRPGCLADLRLTNGTRFSFHTETNQTEVWAFNRPVKTYYALESAPKEKIEAVKALNLQNKLNKESALVLAKKYFKLAGRKEENFHPPKLVQCYWSGEQGGRLPYYEITWDRKDVDLSEDGSSGSKSVIIEVSGIDSSLISYMKGGMPVGSDF